MGRKILFITTDQQRYDTLGCNGGTLSRTPVIDALAANGIRYERAVPQSVVCMPSRSTMLTGQHQHTHGVWMNGVPLPVDAPSAPDVGAAYTGARLAPSATLPGVRPAVDTPEAGMWAEMDKVESLARQKAVRLERFIATARKAKGASR